MIIAAIATLLLTLGCSINITTGDNETQPKQDKVTPPVQDVTEITPPIAEEQISPFTESLNDSKHIEYTGTATVSGTFQDYLREPAIRGQIVCFFPDATTENLIPRTEGDDRKTWFCFDNQNPAKEMLGIDEKKLWFDENESIKCVEGTATIEISKYIVPKIEGAVWDTATLDKVISKTELSTKCSDL